MRALALLLLALLASCRVADQLVGAPKTEGYQVDLRGNAFLTDRALVKAIRLELEDWRAADFSRAYADDAAYQVRAEYLAQGFPFAEVDFEVAVDGAQPLLRFLVREGPRTVLEAVDFPGYGAGSSLPADTLADFYSAPRTGVAGRGPRVYVEGAVLDLADTLVGELRARGHLEARAGEPQVSFSEDRRLARVSLELRAGPRFPLHALTYDLPPGLQLEEVDLEAARRAALGPRPGERPYAPQQVPELRGRLLSALREAGYADAQVDVEAFVDRDLPGVRLAARVRPGPRIRVAGIRIEGRKSGSGGFVRSRLELTEGDLARGSLLRQSVSRLYRSGLFRRVETELEGQGEQRTLVVRVEERPSRELFLEPGYGSYELFRLRSGVRERDLFGTGRGLRAELTAAVRAQHVLLGLSDPEVLGDRNTGDVTLDYDRREQPSFTSVSRGLGAFVTHDWSASGRRATTFGYQFRRSDLEDVEVVTSEVEDALDDLSLSGLRLSHSNDQRDLPLFPRSGRLLEVSAEWGDASLGSDLDYVRLTAAAAQYWPLGERRVLALGARLGSIHATDGAQTIPLQERFFLGGENSVRAYRESELGPTDSQDNPIGGEAFSLVSLELRQDLGASAWQGALFLDAGSVVGRASDLGDLDGYGWGLGLGLRYLLPVGPVRLDAGWNPDANRAEDSLIVHLAVGLAF